MRYVWCTDDLGDLLRGLQQTALLSGRDGDWLAGYRAALVSVAVAVGLDVAAETSLPAHAGSRWDRVGVRART